MNSKHSKQVITSGCMTICFIIVISGSAPAAQITDPHLHKLIKEQESSLSILSEYLLNPHMIKRLRIENLEGISENLPSRIYRAWRMHANKGYPFNVLKRTRDILLQNPKLTLLLLKPILSEPRLSEHDMFILTEQQGVFVPYEEKHLYILFCENIAATEKDGFAHNILTELSKNSDNDISKNALDALKSLKTWNYRYKSDVYKKTGDWKSLHWLIREYFKFDMSAEDVQEVLGKGKQINSNTYVYRGKQDHYLWLFFNDGLLESWEWRDKDKTE